jgi:hypothetical protein
MVSSLVNDNLHIRIQESNYQFQQASAMTIPEFNGADNQHLVSQKKNTEIGITS